MGKTQQAYSRILGIGLILVILMMRLSLADGRQVININNHIPKEALMHALGAMNPHQMMTLGIELPTRNQAELDQLLKNIYDPSSPEYRHYLTPQQITDRYRVSSSYYNAVVVFFQRKGFKVTQQPGRLLMDLDGTVKEVEDTFRISLRVYHHPKEKRDFYAPDKIPSIDLGLKIQSITGLDNFSHGPCPAWGCDGPPKPIGRV